MAATVTGAVSTAPRSRQTEARFYLGVPVMREHKERRQSQISEQMEKR
jgi:hypothetical protein